VGKELAVENPMAREIVNACARLRLETLFEPSKIHPKDWANPGRVKIKLKGGGNSSIKNSEWCFSAVLGVNLGICRWNLNVGIYVENLNLE
jgi:signal recognition particle subunit SRP19